MSERADLEGGDPQCDYCGEDVWPQNNRAIGHICEQCLKKIQVCERADRRLFNVD